MRKMRAFFTLTLLGLMVAAAYFLIPTQDTFSLKSVTDNVGSALKNVGDLSPEFSDTASGVTEQAQSLSKNAGSVLGAISSDKSDQPIHEKAFEYGRYQYCQQVVADYEARQPL